MPVDSLNKVQHVPYLDFKREYQNLKSEYDKAYFKVMSKGHFILGNEVEMFEQNFAKFCNTSHAIGVASGIDALILTLKAWGIGSGDEVIVPANTYIATAFAATQVGAKPVFVDVEDRYYNLDTSLIEKSITKNTKVIAVTHLFGQMADMRIIMQLADKYNLKVLEDAAQAHGAKQDGLVCGSHGHAIAFSFYPTKNLGAFGDAGCIVTDCFKTADTLRYLRNNGSKTKFHYDHIGYNSRLDELQAAFLNIKLKYLNKWNYSRRILAHLYFKNLVRHPYLVLPETAYLNEHVWHVYNVQVLDGRRDELQNYLLKNGIQTNIHYPEVPHLQPCYQDLGYQLGDMPVAERLAESILSLPLSPFHRTSEIEYVCEVLNSWS
jgi:dTDP-4-amino-4,6-dideoxygalactose transaminase